MARGQMSPVKRAAGEKIASAKADPTNTLAPFGGGWDLAGGWFILLPPS